jgi:hypothetical protein
MANIDRIVNVEISLQTAAIAENTFSDLLLYGPFTKVGTSTVGIITSPQDLVDTYGVLTTAPLYKAASTAFAQIPSLNRIFIGWDDAALDATVALNNIKAENNSWYAFCDVSHLNTRTLKMAQWAEANEKLYVTCLNDPNTAAVSPGTDTISVAHQLMQGQYFRTAWWYDPILTDFPDVAIAVHSFSKYPGQETWANQQLQGVPWVPMTETQAQNVFGKNGNTFEQFRNVAITQNGKVSGGEWIDIIRFRDWLCEEIKVNIFQQMIDNRIPYTDHGIGVIRSRLAESLDFGVRRGGIAPPEVDINGKLIPSYTIEVPLAATVSANNKANRLLQDVYFTARVAGAIHVVEIQGALTYQSLPVASVPVIA